MPGDQQAEKGRRGDGGGEETDGDLRRGEKAYQQQRNGDEADGAVEADFAVALFPDMGEGDHFDVGKDEAQPDPQPDVGGEQSPEGVQRREKGEGAQHHQRRSPFEYAAVELQPPDEGEGKGEAHQRRRGEDDADLRGGEADALKHLGHEDNMDGDDGEVEEIEGGDKNGHRSGFANDRRPAKQIVQGTAVLAQEAGEKADQAHGGDEVA